MASAGFNMEVATALRLKRRPKYVRPVSTALAFGARLEVAAEVGHELVIAHEAIGIHRPGTGDGRDDGTHHLIDRWIDG
eukprot:scaffold34555_cov48-Phaeocystis_antarctica.AAC.3